MEKRYYRINQECGISEEDIEKLREWIQPIYLNQKV